MNFLKERVSPAFPTGLVDSANVPVSLTKVLNSFLKNYKDCLTPITDMALYKSKFKYI